MFTLLQDGNNGTFIKWSFLIQIDNPVVILRLWFLHGVIQSSCLIWGVSGLYSMKASQFRSYSSCQVHKQKNKAQPVCLRLCASQVIKSHQFPAAQQPWFWFSRVYCNRGRISDELMLKGALKSLCTRFRSNCENMANCNIFSVFPNLSWATGRVVYLAA